MTPPSSAAAAAASLFSPLKLSGITRPDPSPRMSSPHQGSPAGGTPRTPDAGRRSRAGSVSHRPPLTPEEELMQKVRLMRSFFITADEKEEIGNLKGRLSEIMSKEEFGYKNQMMQLFRNCLVNDQKELSERYQELVTSRSASTRNFHVAIGRFDEYYKVLSQRARASYGINLPKIEIPDEWKTNISLFKIPEQLISFIFIKHIWNNFKQELREECPKERSERYRYIKEKIFATSDYDCFKFCEGSQSYATGGTRSWRSAVSEVVHEIFMTRVRSIQAELEENKPLNIPHEVRELLLTHLFCEANKSLNFLRSLCRNMARKLEGLPNHNEEHLTPRQGKMDFESLSQYLCSPRLDDKYTHLPEESECQGWIELAKSYHRECEHGIATFAKIMTHLYKLEENADLQGNHLKSKKIDTCRQAVNFIQTYLKTQLSYLDSHLPFLQT